MAYVWLMADIPYYAVKQFTVHTSGICTSMTYVLLMAEKRKILRTIYEVKPFVCSAPPEFVHQWHMCC